MEARERNIHANRCVRRYRDREGAEHLHAVGTKRDLAIIDKALERLVDQRFNAARRDGTREPLEVYAFDALRLLAEESMGPGEQRGPARVDPIRHLAVLRIDLTALTRGRVERDEACEIAGLGPISVAAAREMLGESVLKLVITRGVDVVNVTHLGRGPNTAQKVALLCNSPSVHERDAGGTRGSITTIAKTSHGHDTPASTKPIPSATLITI
ncbi:MAG TPA: hypothetical protein VGZ52_12400, partial [Acidimicrobiales bacterium]|nr:hypothetical protein [Acidimicrobiales bacterium]